MESIIFKAFGVIFRLMGILLVTGTLTTALVDLHKSAAANQRHGLVSMLKVNQQLVGK